MTNLIPAEFHGLTLDILDHAGKKWLTAEQIGRALGYDESNARKGVLKLYERHGDEFTEADTFVVKLTTNPQGGNPTTRIFSDTGCIKLGFLANTARAKDFRTWAAKVLVGQSAVPPAPTFARALPGRVRVTRALERQVLEGFVAGHVQSHIARALGLSAATVNLLIHAKYQFAPAAGAHECPPELLAAVAQRHLEVEQARLVEAQQRIAQRFRNTAHNQPLANALDRLGQHLQQAPALALLPLASEGGVQ